MVSRKLFFSYSLNAVALVSWTLGILVVLLVGYKVYKNPKGRFKTYELGRVIDLRSNESFGYLIKGGWSGNESNYRWTDGKEAILSLEIPHDLDTNKQYGFRLKIVDVIDQCQELNFSVNDFFVEKRTICSGDSLLEFRIPGKMMHSKRTVFLHLGLPNAKVLPTDPRQLALGVLSFQFYAYQ